MSFHPFVVCRYARTLLRLYWVCDRMYIFSLLFHVIKMICCFGDAFHVFIWCNKHWESAHAPYFSFFCCCCCLVLNSISLCLARACSRFVPLRRRICGCSVSYLLPTDDQFHSVHYYVGIACHRQINKYANSIFSNTKYFNFNFIFLFLFFISYFVSFYPPLSLVWDYRIVYRVYFFPHSIVASPQLWRAIAQKYEETNKYTQSWNNRTKFLFHDALSYTRTRTLAHSFNIIFLATLCMCTRKSTKKKRKKEKEMESVCTKPSTSSVVAVSTPAMQVSSTQLTDCYRYTCDH